MNEKAVKIAALTAIVFLPILLYCVYVSYHPTAENFTKYYGTEAELTNNKDDRSLLPDPLKRHSFLERATSLDKYREKLRTDPEFKSKVEEKCFLLPQRDQMMSTACKARWQNQLSDNKIEQINEMLGFVNTHWGGIILVLEEGVRGMFKPCSTAEEVTRHEVIVSHMDHILGLGLLAPVATRRVAVSEIQALLSDPEDLKILKKTVDLCSVEDGKYLVGPVIGWLDNLKMIHTLKKQQMHREEMYALRSYYNHTQSQYVAQEFSRFHSLYYLVDILRHGKDEFVNTAQGNLVALDMDRSTWIRNKYPKDKNVRFTWCYVCYVDRRVYEALQAVGPMTPSSLRFSHLVEQSLANETNLPIRLRKTELEAMDDRVERLLDCFDSCIGRYGREKVLLDVQRPFSLQGWVKYLLDHSENQDSYLRNVVNVEVS